MLFNTTAKNREKLQKTTGRTGPGFFYTEKLAFFLTLQVSPFDGHVITYNIINQQTQSLL